MQTIIARIRQEKADKVRAMPSSELIDQSQTLTSARRREILDKVASLVDENLCGRSEMCLQFADLLYRALLHLNIPARPAPGDAIYFDSSGRELFRWQHAWVRIGDEVVDGNVDSIVENPVVPAAVRVRPYWGAVRTIPSDRRLREQQGARLEPDDDVLNIWWPELRVWLDLDGR
jgi:hypothetical protein